MDKKRAQGKLKKIIEQTVLDESALDPRRLWFCVDSVEWIEGRPTRIRIRATLHFLRAGSPFCCGEPGCHTGLTAEEDFARIGDRVKSELGLQHPIVVQFVDGIRTHYESGVEFHYGQHDR